MLKQIKLREQNFRNKELPNRSVQKICKERNECDIKGTKKLVCFVLLFYFFKGIKI